MNTNGIPKLFFTVFFLLPHSDCSQKYCSHWIVLKVPFLKVSIPGVSKLQPLSKIWSAVLFLCSLSAKKIFAFCEICIYFTLVFYIYEYVFNHNVYMNAENLCGSQNLKCLLSDALWKKFTSPWFIPMTGIKTANHPNYHLFVLKVNSESSLLPRA